MANTMERMRKANINHYEVQILESGEKCGDAYDKCPKQKYHKNYININELSEHLPLDDGDLSSFISHMFHLTAMTEIPAEKDVRCGSCLVQKIEMITNIPCPCPECKGKGVNQWGKVTLSTALHVISDQNDAQKCRVRLFYDSPDTQGQEKILHGLKSHTHDGFGDWCALVCVTHDLDLLNKLTDQLTEYWRLGNRLKERYQNLKQNLVVVVSHPHGGPKRVSIGKGKFRDLGREVRDDQDWCFYSYDATTCDGSSGGAVYVLGRWNDGFGYWFGHSHNHSGIDERSYNSSTIGVDSTYGRITTTYSSCEIDNFNCKTDVINPLQSLIPNCENVSMEIDNFSVCTVTGKQKESIENVKCDTYSNVGSIGKLTDSISGSTGKLTESISGSTGKFTETISGSTGKFTETISGSTGKFTETISGFTGKFTETISGSTGTFTDSNSDSTGKFIESVSGSAGIFTESISGSTSIFTESISGSTGIFTESISDSTGKIIESCNNTSSRMTESQSNSTGKMTEFHSITTCRITKPHNIVKMITSYDNTTGKITESHSNSTCKFTKSHSSSTGKMAESKSNTTVSMTKSHSNTTVSMTKSPINTTVSMTKSPINTTVSMTKSHSNTTVSMTKSPINTTGNMIKSYCSRPTGNIKESHCSTGNITKSNCITGKMTKSHCSTNKFYYSTGKIRESRCSSGKMIQSHCSIGKIGESCCSSGKMTKSHFSTEFCINSSNIRSHSNKNDKIERSYIFTDHKLLLLYQYFLQKTFDRLCHYHMMFQNYKLLLSCGFLFTSISLCLS